jgi:DNA-binding NarL/FixJ family response regulator
MTLGYSDSEIPKLLHISSGCRERSLRNLLRKLKLHDISSAIECALSMGLVRITYA